MSAKTGCEWVEWWKVAIGLLPVGNVQDEPGNGVGKCNGVWRTSRELFQLEVAVNGKGWERVMPLL